MNAKPAREPFRWLVNNPLVALTIIGLLLYATFAIPATFFYGRLGTTPSEVGYTYATILSGSTLGALIIVACSLLVIFYIVQLALVSVLYGIAFRVSFIVMRHPTILRQDWRLDTDQFEEKLTITKKIYSYDQETWKDLERAFRRRRALMKMENPSAAEESEMKALGRRIPRLQVKHLTSLIVRGLRPRFWYIYFVLPVLVAFTIILTAIAINQASHVTNGTAETTGNQYGLFEYNVESASVAPAQRKDRRSIDPLVGKKLYLLGQNAQYVILYVPQLRSTVRIPIAAVIVTSSP